MTLPPPKVCRIIQGLHALIGSSNAAESEAAHKKLIKLLAKRGLTWNDLPAILALAVANTKTTSNASAQAAVAPEVNVLDLVLRLLELHIATTAEERMAVALWILHTYVFDRFQVTPRLVLLSPVRGCGKTTLLILLELLVAEAYRSDNITAAAIYHTLDLKPHIALLIDEGDNLDLFRNNVLRSVFNAGHRRGGSIDRFIGGWPKKFRVFAPLAIAAIGTLPLPLMHRAVVINMQRLGETRPKRLDENEPASAVVFAAMAAGVRSCVNESWPALI